MPLEPPLDPQREEDLEWCHILHEGVREERKQARGIFTDLMNWVGNRAPNDPEAGSWSGIQVPLPSQDDINEFWEAVTAEKTRINKWTDATTLRQLYFCP